METREIEDNLKKYGQDHIVNLLNKLNGDKKDKLIRQIEKIDFEQMNNLYKNATKKIDVEENSISAINYLDKEKLSYNQKEHFDSIGEEIIKSGQYAVVTMAGGQGTRLGHDGPKGTFKLDVYGKGKYIFEILTETLKLANKKYGVTIPWYIMTSKDNNNETQAFLEKNNYFGYNKEDVILFEQNELPLLDMNGKYLIGKDKKIKKASDGNGGVFSSLRGSGIIADMKEKGTKWVFIGGVDNVLVKMVDTTLLGMTIDEGLEVGAKSVVKSSPKERVGVFCKINNHPKVIEYSELPEDMAEERDSSGELRYGEANIVCNLFSIDALEKISKEVLIYHTAIKKNSYLDESGKEIIPEEPNSYKFEAFIFDAFELFDDMAILRVKREEEFAPVKNREGEDSPRTAKELYERYWNKIKK